MSTEPIEEKRIISPKEFRENGYLMELNRRFLHPLGMALEIVVDQNGNERFGNVWDCRSEKDGIIFAEEQLTTHEKTLSEAFEHFQHQRHNNRKQLLGYVVQPITVPQGDNEGEEHANKEVRGM